MCFYETKSRKIALNRFGVYSVLGIVNPFWHYTSTTSIYSVCCYFNYNTIVLPFQLTYFEFSNISHLTTKEKKQTLKIAHAHSIPYSPIR